MDITNVFYIMIIYLNLQKNEVDIYETKTFSQ